MKKITNYAFIACLVLFVVPGLSQAGFFDDLKKSAKKLEKTIKDTKDAIQNPTKSKKKKAPAKEKLNAHQLEHLRNEIRNAQKGLTKLGYYSGDLNGKLDSRTRNSVEKYQKDKKLKVDGELSRFMQEHISCSLGNNRGCRYVQSSPEGRQMAVNEAKQKRADKEKPFDSYTGPRAMNGTESRLLHVYFDKESYQIGSYKLHDRNANRELRKLLEGKYKKEWDAMRSNEFAMRRDLPKLHKRLMDEADKASANTTFRFVCKSGLGQYDFDNQVFPIRVSGCATITLNKLVAGKPIPLSIGIDKAEQFKKDHAQVYVEGIYQVEDSYNMKVGYKKAPRFLGKIKNLKLFAKGSTMPGKETLVSGLLMDIPISSLITNKQYTANGGELDSSISAQGDNSMQISF